jgi:hypothetical protein
MAKKNKKKNKKRNQKTTVKVKVKNVHKPIPEPPQPEKKGLISSIVRIFKAVASFLP